MELLVSTWTGFANTIEAHDALVKTVWRHHSGREYLIESVAREEDLGVNMVVHVGMHDGRRWVRTVENFLGSKNGKPRFTPVS